MSFVICSTMGILKLSRADYFMRRFY